MDSLRKDSKKLYNGYNFNELEILVRDRCGMGITNISPYEGYNLKNPASSDRYSHGVVHGHSGLMYNSHRGHGDIDNLFPEGFFDTTHCVTIGWHAFTPQQFSITDGSNTSTPHDLYVGLSEEAIKQYIVTDMLEINLIPRELIVKQIKSFGNGYQIYEISFKMPRQDSMEFILTGWNDTGNNPVTIKKEPYPITNIPYFFGTLSCSVSGNMRAAISGIDLIRPLIKSINEKVPYNDEYDFVKSLQTREGSNPESKCEQLLFNRVIVSYSELTNRNNDPEYHFTGWIITIG